MFWIYTREKVVWGEMEYVKVWKKEQPNIPMIINITVI